MEHLLCNEDADKGWYLGPWNSELPIPVGYANRGVDERHCHAQMHEIYLVACGRSEVIVEGRRLTLQAGDVLLVEPGEVHTFVDSSADYFHFVVQAPFVPGDKVIVEEGGQ